MHLPLREITQLAETNKLNQHGSYSSFIFTRPLYKYIFISQFLRVAPNSSVESAHVQVNFVLVHCVVVIKRTFAFHRGRLGSILDSTPLCRRFGLFVLCSSLWNFRQFRRFPLSSRIQLCDEKQIALLRMCKSVKKQRKLLESIFSPRFALSCNTNKMKNKLSKNELVGRHLPAKKDWERVFVPA